MKQLLISLLILFATIVAVWAQDPDNSISKNSWRVNNEGKIQRISAEQKWVNVEIPTSQPMTALHFLTDDYGWAVGHNAILLRWDGERWSEVLVFSNEKLFSVFLSDFNEGWAVGANGIILRWNGTSWNPESSPTTETLVSIKPSPTGAIQITTENGLLLEKKGGVWQIQSEQLTVSAKRTE